MVVQRGTREILEIAPYQAESWHKSKVCHPSTYPPIHPSIHSTIRPFDHSTIRPFDYLSIYLFSYLPISLFPSLTLTLPLLPFTSTLVSGDFRYLSTAALPLFPVVHGFF